VKRNATDAEIKEAYKNLAKKYHPDVNKDSGAEEKFKEALEAYHVLSDPQKRANYDQFGHAAEQFQGYRGFEGFGTGMDFDFEDLFNGFGRGFGGLEDLFREFGIGGAGGGRRERRGESIRMDLNISLEEAAFGVKKEIEVERLESCDACNGTGARHGSGLTSCPKCNGKGAVERVQRTPFGIFSTRTVCGRCGGEGKIIKEPCTKCNGSGRMLRRRKIEVKIPAGVNTGNHLRLKGEGNAGEKGAGHGDLFVVVFVEPHKLFKRDGRDIFIEIPISFAEAALGAEVEAPTLRGTAKIKVPAGTQTHTIFRLREQGIKEPGSSALGDEYVKVIVKTPEKMQRGQRELFEEMQRQEKLGEERKSFFEKLKKRFS
jgi:molecular chaperone DnaJ